MSGAAARRRARVMLALEDGEYRLGSVAAWAEVSRQAARSDLGWLHERGFVARGYSEGRDGVIYPHWTLTDAGRGIIAELEPEEAW